MNKVNNALNSIGAFVKNNKYTVAIGAVLIIVIIFFQGGSSINYQTYQVEKADVIDAVELTGSVSAVDRADLAFSSSGKVSTIAVNEGDEIARGATIAKLETNDLSAQLLRSNASVSAAIAALEQARANLDAVRASNSGTLTTIASARENLDSVTAEQNQLVENARRALLSGGLAAYPVNSSRNVIPPTITGTYNSVEEGEYRLEFYRSGTGTGFSARYSGLESGIVSFSDGDLAQPLGTRGLFVSISEDTGSYNNLVFTIPIPNPRGSTYQTLLNAYESSLEARDRAINAATNQLDQLIATENNGLSTTSAEERRALAQIESAKAGLAQAQADVALVQSQINDRIITAPFNGVIGRIDMNIGEIVASNQSVATLVSDGDFEIELQVPEIDVAKIEVGMAAIVTLDAYNDSATWQAEVSAIEQIETIVEGVPVYLTTLRIINPDNRIKVGMNARAEIELRRVEDVIAIPRSYIVDDNSRRYVLTGSPDAPIETDVKIGLIGSDSMVEVVSGLKSGQTVMRVLDKVND